MLSLTFFPMDVHAAGQPINEITNYTVTVDVDNKSYAAGETISFDFKILQDNMYQMEK